MNPNAPDILRHVEARTHGRYVVRTPAAEPPPWPLLLSFHGYAETASVNMDAIARIPGADRWLLAAVQALHPFYTQDQRVVANWMTREDRGLAIADNLDYVGRVVEAVRREFPTRRPLVFAGFSQGGAMAYRAAERYEAAAVIILAADVPPDVAPSRLPRVLLGRGTRDSWYTEEKHRADLDRLHGSGSPVVSCVFDGAHEWSAPFYTAAGRLLADLQSGP